MLVAKKKHDASGGRSGAEPSRPGRRAALGQGSRFVRPEDPSEQNLRKKTYSTLASNFHCTQSASYAHLSNHKGPPGERERHMLSMARSDKKKKTRRERETHTKVSLYIHRRSRDGASKTDLLENVEVEADGRHDVLVVALSQKNTNTSKTKNNGILT